MLFNDEQALPLKHLRVVDFSIMLPAPYLTRILTQYGADVIKVEHLPHGDPLRQREHLTLFNLLNAGKRSIAVDLKSQEGKNLIHQLVAEADIFFENFREGLMDSMDLGYSQLCQTNPDLIYLSLRGFAGKRTTDSGHDLNFIAQSGVGEWFLENGSPNYSTQFADLIGGTFVPALKLLLHLANPERRGMHLISYMDQAFRALYLPRAHGEWSQRKNAPDGKAEDTHSLLNGSKPHSRFYRCRDHQWISLNAIQQKHWEVFCEIVDRPTWKVRSNDATLIPEMEKLFEDAPSSYWEALSANKQPCLFRVIPWEEHIKNTTFDSQMQSDPLAWASFAPNPNLSPAPALGAQTETILQAQGFAPEEIAGWLKKGVLGQTK